MEDVKEGRFQPNIVYQDGNPVEFASLPLTCFEGGDYQAVAYDSISALLEDYYSARNRVNRIKQKSVDLRKIVQTLLERNYKKYDLQEKQLKDTEKREKYRIYGELFYRDNYENLYFWKGQEEANSLADVTWGVYGDDIFGSEIYIIGEEWEDAEYRTDAFWRPYRRDPSQPLPTVKFIDSLGEAWPITDRDKKIVLKEDPEHHRYVDVTSMIKIKKYQNVYGYYEYDGWMDQKTKIRVFTGTSGQLRIGFYAPKEITGNETITVSSGDRLIQEIHLKDHWADLVIPVMKQRYIELDIECNFYSVDPNQEMRGETPMAVNVQMSAE